MGRLPAYLFVVRHGNRLDAADKQWHLSSPTPYDPPLTYGGWLQAKALGVRISAIIRDRIQEDEARQVESDGPPRRRKYKVIIHSSPFLRCIQTSVAIAAGLAQDPSPLQTAGTADQSSKSATPVDAAHKPTVVTKFDSPKTRTLHKTRKSTLRLDAFLGEWLSPSYFDLITPPPGSVMMLASAKADLLRREAYESYPTFNAHNHSGSHGQLWGGSPRASPVSPKTGGGSDGLESMDAMSNSLPSPRSTSGQTGQQGRTSAEKGGYVAPVPNYAASSSATIPIGYVAHARDVCVDIDYQWDSMRGPLEWGDGGTFGEEWTAMHHRFRKGIQKLVEWYAQAQEPTEMVTKTAGHARRGSEYAGDCAIEDSDSDQDDEDTEAVVIMVSHGAGCNALIGAITHQPVLMDVGIASLTMAVRKPDAAEVGPNAVNAQREQADNKPGHVTGNVIIHEQYDLKLFANTDHLRSANPTPVPSRSSSVAGAMAKTRGRFSNSFSSPLHNFTLIDGAGSRSSSANAALSMIRRASPASPTIPRGGVWDGAPKDGGITVGSGVTSFANSNTTGTKSNTSSNSSSYFSLARTPTYGLWSPIQQREGSEATPDEEYDSMVLNFSHEKTAARSAAGSSLVNASNSTEPGTNGKQKELATEPLENAATSSPSASPGVDGLWSSGPRPPGEAERIRDLSLAKRRWTVNDERTALDARGA